MLIPNSLKDVDGQIDLGTHVMSAVFHGLDLQHQGHA